MKYEAEFIEIIKQNQALIEILDHVATLELPNYYLAAGCVFQTVWNKIDGKSPDYGLHDIDLVFYDAEKVNPEFDLKLEKSLSAKFGKNFDVHNEAGMHLTNGRSKPYLSCEDAIANWIATVHCVGISGTSSNLTIYAPYGLEDIFRKRVAATYAAEISREVYKAKVVKWQARFEGLTVIPFDESKVKDEI